MDIKFPLPFTKYYRSFVRGTTKRFPLQLFVVSTDCPLKLADAEARGCEHFKWRFISTMIFLKTHVATRSLWLVLSVLFLGRRLDQF